MSNRLFLNSSELAQDAVGGIFVDSTSIDFTYVDATPSITAVVLPAGVDHNSLANLVVGDVHTQYALLAGRATPQQFNFGTASGAATGYLSSTAHATKGKYFLNAAGNIVVDEANTRIGIGRTPTDFALEINGALWINSSSIIDFPTDNEYQILRRSGVDQARLLVQNTEPRFQIRSGGSANAFGFSVTTGIFSIMNTAGYLDLSTISAGNPNLKITATSDTPTVAFTGGGNAPTTAPAGYLEILVGATSRYIPFWA